MQPGQNSVVTYAITVIVIGIVMAFRWRRMSRPVPLRIGRLWIVPAVYALVVTAMYVRFPPTGWNWVWCLIALMIGAALGWQRGRTMRIAIDPATHAISQTSSPAALLFVVAIILLRQGAQAGSGWLHLDVMAVTDMAMAMALGLFAAQRLEMCLRARRLLLAARAIPA
ncbi:hypothetical protein GCM10022268_09610 [Sphingomonas cynarae]|uniref:DUF1453 family protein n=1 Tax=Sphingomonas cynarae TaxID=930197 RepID=A0ABP7DAR6_9SPHN